MHFFPSALRRIWVIGLQTSKQQIPLTIPDLSGNQDISEFCAQLTRAWLKAKNLRWNQAGLAKWVQKQVWG